MPLVWTRWMDNYYVRWIPFCKEEPGHPWSLELPCRVAVRKALSGQFITIFMWRINGNVSVWLVCMLPPTYTYADCRQTSVVCCERLRTSVQRDHCIHGNEEHRQETESCLENWWLASHAGPRKISGSPFEILWKVWNYWQLVLSDKCLLKTGGF